MQTKMYSKYMRFVENLAKVLYIVFIAFSSHPIKYTKFVAKRLGIVEINGEEKVQAQIELMQRIADEINRMNDVSETRKRVYIDVVEN